MKKVLFVLLLTLVTASCATIYRQYQGPQRSEAQLAILEHPNPQHSLFILENVNGEWRGTGLISRYELLPGEQRITCALHSTTHTGGKVDVYFKAEAGRKYVAQAITKNNRWTVQILDKTTNRFVGYYK